MRIYEKNEFMDNDEKVHILNLKKKYIILNIYKLSAF